MKKYFAIMKTEFQRQLTYRLDFFGFRFSNIIEIGSQMLVWTVVYNEIEIIEGYSYKEMMSYIVIGWSIMFLTQSYGFEDNVARDIYQGRLSNFLVKPMSYLRYMSILSIARVSIALASSVILQALIILAFHRFLLMPAGFFSLVIIFVMVILAYFINLFVAILTGFIAFWTTEINGIYKGAAFLKRFLSGNFFPINLLPLVFLKISLAFPFAYTFFVPTQIYLGKMNLNEGIRGIGIEIGWLFILFLIIRLVWKKGLKKYESVGI